MKADASIFKAYDVRGVVDQTLTEDAVRAVGRFLGTMTLDNAGNRFCVGRNGCMTGERLQNALMKDVSSTGFDDVLYSAVRFIEILLRALHRRDASSRSRTECSITKRRKNDHAFS